MLCDRIGIMAHGTLRCIGTPLHLKNRYADGYRIKVNFAPRDEFLVSTIIQKYLPEALVLILITNYE